MNRFTVRRAFRRPSRPEWGAGAIAPAPQVTASGVPENAAIRGTRGVILAWAILASPSDRPATSWVIVPKTGN